MKKNIMVKTCRAILYLIWSFLVAGPLSAQNNAQDEKSTCGITSDNSQPYFRQIAGNIRQMIAENSLNNSAQPVPEFATPTVKLGWPLRPNNVSNFSYYRITNFVDLDPAREVRDADDNYVSGRLDYNCGTRNYDGHNGLDISIMPYGWKMQFEEKVSVVASADGIIVGGDDGNFDENCDTDNITGPTWGNWIAIMHADSTVTTYIHLKSNSVIPVILRTRVYEGQFLGYVASSGRSTGPHLHYGVYINNSFLTSGGWNDSFGDLHEPFFGSCNNALPSFWQSQKPYNEPAVIAIETHNALPGSYADNCDKTITLSFDKNFSAGDLVYARTLFRDWVDGSTALIQLISPGGSLLSATSVTNSNNSRSRTVNTLYSLSSSAAAGTYTVRVTFDGKIWERHFTVGCVQNYTVSGTLTAPKGYVAGNTITTTHVVESGSDNRVEYHADNEIIFSVGFHAKAGSQVIADRKGCAGGYH